MIQTKKNKAAPKCPIGSIIFLGILLALVLWPQIERMFAYVMAHALVICLIAAAAVAACFSDVLANLDTGHCGSNTMKIDWDSNNDNDDDVYFNPNHSHLACNVHFGQ